MASAIPWGKDRHRQHEIAHYLAERCPVMYLNPPSGRAAEPPRAEVISPRLTVVSVPGGPYPGGWASPAMNRANRRHTARELGALFPDLTQGPLVLWLDESAAEPYIDLLDSRLVVYDCADEDYAFAHNPLRRRMLKAYEDRVTRRADLVFVSAVPLLERKRELNPRTHLALNAVDFEHFARVAAAHPPVGDGAPVIGFVGGALRDRMDYELLAHVALARPQWRVELVGRVEWPRGFRPPVNLVSVGSRPYADLPEVMARHSVCIIPYRGEGRLSYIHPKKLFEYLAAGKPVVSTELPAVLPYAGIVKIAGTHAEFVARIEECLAENADPAMSAALVRQRMALARENGWPHRVAEMAEVVEAAFAERQA